MRTSLLHGLTPKDSILAFHKLLFPPLLETHFGAEQTFNWCIALLENASDPASFSAQYTQIATEVGAFTATKPAFSIVNPPPAMISIDLFVGAIPWASPAFDRWLLHFLSIGGAVADPGQRKTTNAEVLALAFVLSGGPGDTKDTAIRICAPSQTARIAAEHWLMRAYLWRREENVHFTLGPDENGRTFSLHHYTDRAGDNQRIFFETTGSFGHEDADFLDFLHRDT